MKNKVQNPLKLGLLLAAFLMVGNVAFGATYTAVASGNWSSAATWGGSAPPFNVTGSDQINVGVGITVTMDQNVVINNALASLTVNGTLTGDPFIKLDVVSGTIEGSVTGNIKAANVALNAGGFFNFSGSLTADTLTNAIVSLDNSAQIMVNDALVLPAVVNLELGGSITMGANSNIIVAGGDLALIGGTLNLTASYNVYYGAGSANIGAELGGSGLKNVTVNVGASNNLSLGGDLVTNDSLKIVSGALFLNGSSLTVNGALTGNVMIEGYLNSNLTINTPGGVSAAITFPQGFQSLNNLTINVGSGNSVQIASNLDVLGSLAISKGNNLNITGENLMIGGNLNTNGNIIVNSSSQLNLESGSSVTGSLSLTGADLGKFMLNIGNANQASLATNLTVDTLSLQSGALVLNGNNLTVNAGIAAGGNGMIAANGGKSDIMVSSSADVHGALSFSAAADTVKNLTVSVNGGGSLKLGSNLVVNNALTFTAGFVNVQSNNLMIGAAGSINGASDNAYVITGIGGYLTMFATVGNNVTFAVGNGSQYFPAVINLNNGSAVGTIGLNVSSEVYANGVSGVVISNVDPMVDATWLFQNNIGAGLNANMQLSWQASAEVNGFTHAEDYISHYAASAWDDIGDSMTATLNGSLYTVTRANVVSMSPFAVFDGATVPTGIAAVTSTSSQFEVYPNPTYDNLYVKNPSNNGATVYVDVYNTLGQVVASTHYNNDLLTLPVSSLPVGNYLVRLYNDDMSVTKKFVKIQ